MGVLNVTPDSFSDGGRFASIEAAVNHALRMVEEGAGFIDVGGESTRPGAQAVSAEEEIRRIVMIFRELRAGMTSDGKTKLKSPSGTLSTAEAISVVNSGLALSAHFGDGKLRAHDVASGLVGAIIKDPVQDKIVWQEYLETVVKERKDWKDLYRACKESID